MESPERPRSGQDNDESNPYGTTKSLALVRTKQEEPEVQRERAELTRSKTPAELGQIRGLGDIPIPGLWAEHEVAKPQIKRKKKRYVLVFPCLHVMSRNLDILLV